MTLLFALLLFAVPGAAFWTTVPSLDPVGRLVVSVVASIVAVAGTAQLMLMADAWSPGRGVLALLVLSALSAAACRVLHRRGRPHPQAAVATAAPAPPPASPPPPAGANVTRRDIPVRRRGDDEDDWIYRD